MDLKLWIVGAPEQLKNAVNPSDPVTKQYCPRISSQKITGRAKFIQLFAIFEIHLDQETHDC